MEYYWELIQHDGTVTLIPPEAVETVKRRWDNKDPIHTSTGSIPANQIQAFRVSDKPHGAQPLLEAVAQAFDEPVYTEEGAVVARWVKKNVPMRMFNKYYSAIPAYRMLGEMNGMAIIAFRLPVHQINTSSVTYCSEDDIRYLTR